MLARTRVSSLGTRSRPASVNSILTVRRSDLRRLRRTRPHFCSLSSCRLMEAASTGMIRAKAVRVLALPKNAASKMAHWHVVTPVGASCSPTLFRSPKLDFPPNRQGGLATVIRPSSFVASSC